MLKFLGQGSFGKVINTSFPHFFSSKHLAKKYAHRNLISVPFVGLSKDTHKGNLLFLLLLFLFYTFSLISLYLSIIIKVFQSPGLIYFSGRQYNMLFISCLNQGSLTFVRKGVLVSLFYAGPVTVCPLLVIPSLILSSFTEVNVCIHSCISASIHLPSVKAVFVKYSKGRYWVIYGLCETPFHGA